jgi:hypothetical protein
VRDIGKISPQRGGILDESPLEGGGNARVVLIFYVQKVLSR